MPQPAPDRAPLQARPGRPVLVAGDLADLRGPVTGTVELPLWLFWSPDRTFDLDDPATLRWMYETVLREAARPEDLVRLPGRRHADRAVARPFPAPWRPAALGGPIPDPGDC